MKVQHIMSVDVYSAGPKTPLRELWKAIFKRGIHCIPVVDAKKRLVGIIAEEDLLKPLYPDYMDFVEDYTSTSDFEQMEKKIKELANLKAEHIMSRRVIFTRAETPIMRALSRMIVRKVALLPVLSQNDTLIGVVTKGDIFDSLVKRHLMRAGDARSGGIKSKKKE